jgi:hypothetical protein
MKNNKQKAKTKQTTSTKNNQNTNNKEPNRTRWEKAHYHWKRVGKGKLSFSLQTFAPRWNQDRAVQWLDRCTFQ